MLATPELLSVAPASGIAGTVVTLTGSNFVPSVPALCRFGSVNISATFSSTTSVLCSAPPQATISTVEVAVTFNSADYTSNYVPFAYLGIFLVMICDVTHGVVMPHLDEVIPLVGPTTGGSVITLNGANITNTPTLFCKDWVGCSQGNVFLVNFFAMFDPAYCGWYCTDRGYSQQCGLHYQWIDVHIPR